MLCSNSDLNFWIGWCVKCPNPNCKEINELNLIVILMSPSPDALMTSKCVQCHEDYAVRWTTRQPERIQEFLSKLMTFQQDGEKLIRKHLSDFGFGLVAMSATLPNARRRGGWVEAIRRKLGQRRRRTGDG